MQRPRRYVTYHLCPDLNGGVASLALGKGLQASKAAVTPSLFQSAIPLTPELVRPHDLTRFDIGPNAGDPDYICSYCGGRITADQLPLCAWAKQSTGEWRLCEICLEVILPSWIKGGVLGE